MRENINHIGRCERAVDIVKLTARICNADAECLEHPSVNMIEEDPPEKKRPYDEREGHHPAKLVHERDIRKALGLDKLEVQIDDSQPAHPLDQLVWPPPLEPLEKGHLWPAGGTAKKLTLALVPLSMYAICRLHDAAQPSEHCSRNHAGDVARTTHQLGEGQEDIDGAESALQFHHLHQKGPAEEENDADEQPG